MRKREVPGSERFQVFRVGDGETREWQGRNEEVDQKSSFFLRAWEEIWKDELAYELDLAFPQARCKSKPKPQWKLEVVKGQKRHCYKGGPVSCSI